MWRSVFLGKASSTSKQILNRNNFLTTTSQCPKVLVSSSYLTKPHFSNEFNIYLNNPRMRILLLSHLYYSSDSSSSFDNEQSPDLISSKNDSFNEVSSLGSENGYAHDVKMSNIDEISEDVYEIDVEKLESVLSLLQSSVDGSLESLLDKLDLDLNEEFVMRVLETELIPGENLIGFYKWVEKKEGFVVSTRVVSVLAKGVCGQLRKKDAYALWDLVKEIGRKGTGVVSVEILNELIGLFSRLGKGKAGFEVFSQFEEFGCVPNEDTHFFAVEALCRRSFYDWAVTVSEKMIGDGILPSDDRLGNVISWFCKGSKAKHAHSVYSLAKEKNKNSPQSSVNFLISSLCREDETVKLALEMLDDLSSEARQKSIKSFSTVIHGLCRINDVEAAKKVLHKMIDAGPPPGNNVFNYVINALSKAGDMEDAKEIMKLMENRGLKPDVYTYSVIMSGYVKGGQMEDACKVLSEAKKRHSKLTPVTYHILIRGYCKLEQFDKALELLGEMKNYGVQPNTDEYNKLIQSLCLKAQDWEAAEKLLAEMKENGLHLNGITKGLIQAVKDLEAETIGTEVVIAEA